MNHAVSKRPTANLLFLYPPFVASSTPAFRRQESSARRTTKRLRVKPDPSFTGRVPVNQLQDHVIFNPPSSAPSQYQTPLAFLPPNDPRRALLARSHEHANPYAQPNKRLPPPLEKPQEKKYHLKEEDIAEMRYLRQKDPFTWTRSRLAEKFDCSQAFVAVVCEASKERKQEQQQVLERIKDRWGTRRRHAREDREKRKALWGRDD